MHGGQCRAGNRRLSRSVHTARRHHGRPGRCAALYCRLALLLLPGPKGRGVAAMWSASVAGTMRYGR